MDSKEFARRRKTLMRMVGQEGIAILPAAPVRKRSRDVEYRFRQDSDFYYLTGFPEPEAVAVLVPGRDKGEYVIFCRERNPDKERWDGKRAGPEGAVELYGADDAFPIDDIDDILPGIMESCSRVYYTMGVYAEFDQAAVQAVTLSREARRTRGVVVEDQSLHGSGLHRCACCWAAVASSKHHQPSTRGAARTSQLSSRKP